MRRVVVTGLGMVTPLACGVEETWSRLLAGQSGAGPITRFDASDQKCRIACEVKPADHPYGFDPNKRVDHKVQRQVDPFIVMDVLRAARAAEEAGRHIIHMEIGQPATPAPSMARKALASSRKTCKPPFPPISWPCCATA